MKSLSTSQPKANANIKETLRGLKTIARYHGYPQEADDFSQWAFMKLWQGRKATYKQLFVDYKREHIYDSRRKQSRDKRSVAFTYAEDQDYFFERVAFERPKEEKRIYDHDVLVSHLPERHFNILVLKQSGMPMYAIGTMYGVTQSAISQQMKRIKQNIKKWQEVYGDA